MVCEATVFTDSWVNPPRFARGAVKPSDVSFNVYAGGGAWNSYFGADVASLIKN